MHIYAPPLPPVTYLRRTGDSPFFSGEENLAPRLICIFVFSHLIDKLALHLPKPDRQLTSLCVIQNYDLVFISQVYLFIIDQCPFPSLSNQQ